MLIFLLEVVQVGSDYAISTGEPGHKANITFDMPVLNIGAYVYSVELTYQYVLGYLCDDLEFLKGPNFTLYLNDEVLYELPEPLSGHSFNDLTCKNARPSDFIDWSTNQTIVVWKKLSPKNGDKIRLEVTIFTFF